MVKNNIYENNKFLILIRAKSDEFYHCIINYPNQDLKQADILIINRDKLLNDLIPNLNDNKIVIISDTSIENTSPIFHIKISSYGMMHYALQAKEKHIDNNMIISPIYIKDAV
jgi:hypothetical protein